jgi:hypothetical protein
LNKILTCEICQKYYLNPVLLPCGNNLCNEHVKQKIEENDSNIYKCDFCNENHEVLENGYFSNRILIEMINNKIHLDERTKIAKKVIEDLDTSNKEFDLMRKDPENFIYNYFSKEINKIDLRRETLISKINEISDEMINKIKLMQNDSKSNLIDKKQNLIDSIKFDFKKLSDEVLKWNEEIRNPKLDKTRLEEIIKESIDLIKNNEKQSFEFKNKILNKKGCYFSPNNDEFKEKLFGELIIDDFSLTNKHEKPVTPIVLDSNIVSLNQSQEFIKLCEFQNKKEFKLLYRASRDGFSGTQFHSKCDNISKTLSIIKVKDKPHIFGGYTEATWEDKTYKQDPNAFIFSLVNNDNKPIKMKINKNIQYAICCYSSYGPTFGGGYDFCISSDSNTNTESYSDLGDTYQHPNYQYKSNEARSFLAGSRNFSTSEIEVYQVI